MLNLFLTSNRFLCFREAVHCPPGLICNMHENCIAQVTCKIQPCPLKVKVTIEVHKSFCIGG